MYRKKVFIMVALRTVDFRNDFKRVSEIVYSGEKVLIARPKNQNLVVLSERDYNELEKAKRNAEYLAKLNESRQQIEDGKVVVKTIEELEEMAK
jgi:antitoxin YefM